MHQPLGVLHFCLLPEAKGRHIEVVTYPIDTQFQNIAADHVQYKLTRLGFAEVEQAAFASGTRIEEQVFVFTVPARAFAHTLRLEP